MSDPIEEAADRRRTERVSVIITALSAGDTETVTKVFDELEHDFGGKDAFILALARRAVQVADVAEANPGLARDDLLQLTAAKDSERFEQG